MSARAIPDRTGPPPGGPPPVPELPTFQTRRLSNGLRVDVTHTRSTPDVAIRLVTEAGAGTTPCADAGLASLACDLLSEGADGRSAMEMAEWIDGLGAAFTARATYDAAVIAMHATNDQLEAAMDFLAAVVRHPDFAAGEVARRRELVLNRLRRRRDEPAEIASDALDAAIFGDHPYAAPLIGTLESVEGLDAGSLANFWTDRVRPDTSVLVICGDVEPEAAFAAANALFGGWEPAAGAPPVTIPSSPGAAARAGDVLLIDRPSSLQTELRIGGIGLARGEEGEDAALVMNTILGGLFNSRINLNLREEKGWTYGARTAFLRRRRAGPFIGRTAVATEVTADAFREVAEECARMRDEPPTERELELAANALTLSLPLQFQTSSQLARRQAETITYGLPADYWETYPARIRAVTAEQVRAAAERLLDPGGLVFLAVGAVADFAAELAPLGAVDVTPA